MKKVFIFMLLASTLASGATFEKAKDKTLKWEGGELYTPAVTTERSRWGMQQHVNLDIYNKRHGTNYTVETITKDQATKVLKELYWDGHRYEELESQMVANQAFDYAFNAGKREAIKVLQKSINKAVDVLNKRYGYNYTHLKIDGILGSATINKANYLTPAVEKDLYEIYKQERLKKYKRKKYWNHFGAGWANRINDI